MSNISIDEVSTQQPDDYINTTGVKPPYFVRNISVAGQGGVNFGQALQNRNVGNGMGGGPVVIQEERNWVVVGILIGLIVILWVILAFMLCVPLIRCIRRKIPVSRKRIDRRYETVEGWLITKVVKKHDECCQRIHEKYALKDGEEVTVPASCSGTAGTCTTCTGTCTCAVKTGVKTAVSYDSSDTHDIDAGSLFCPSENMMECPICMESFEEDQIVSWSAFEKCCHVFHHECIKEWLLRHKNCPFCREVFLPVDQDNLKGRARSKMLLFKELADIRSKRSDSTYFCIDHGLVVVNRKALDEDKSKNNITKSQMEEIRIKIKTGVHKSELKKLRGSRMDKETMVEDLPVIDDATDEYGNDENDNHYGDVEVSNGETDSSNDLHVDQNNSDDNSTNEHIDEPCKDTKEAESTTLTESSSFPSRSSSALTQRTEPNSDMAADSVVSPIISFDEEATETISAVGGAAVADEESGDINTKNSSDNNDTSDIGESGDSDGRDAAGGEKNDQSTSSDVTNNESIEAVIVTQGANDDIAVQDQPKEQLGFSEELAADLENVKSSIASEAVAAESPDKVQIINNNSQIVDVADGNEEDLDEDVASRIFAWLDGDASPGSNRKINKEKSNNNVVGNKDSNNKMDSSERGSKRKSSKNMVKNDTTESNNDGEKNSVQNSDVECAHDGGDSDIPAQLSAIEVHIL